LVPGVPEDDNNWSAGDVSADGAVLYLATSDGGLSIVDSRSNSSSSGGSAVIANRKVSDLCCLLRMVNMSLACFTWHAFVSL
jgi:hypothetical protein